MSISVYVSSSSSLPAREEDNESLVWYFLGRDERGEYTGRALVGVDPGLDPDDLFHLSIKRV